MRSAFLLLSGATAAFASPSRVKRAMCTVESLGNPLADDVPAITEELKQCGDAGRVLLPANQTFHICSPVDLSPCRRCDFHINGVLNVSPDREYWKKQPAVFQISKSTNVIIHSDGNTGTIDANNFGWSSGSVPLEQVPVLFRIGDESYQIHIRDLKLKNILGTAFHISSNSSAVRFYGINFQTPAATSYLVEQAQHVYVWNTTIQATKSCVSILPNSSNIQVEESTCITTGRHTAQSGFELRFGTGGGFDWIRNVFVKRINAVGNMDVVSFLAGSGEGEPHPVKVDNTTFIDITIEGPAAKAVNLEEGLNTLTTMDVTFRDFEGEAQNESDLQCTNSADVCELKVEDWKVVIRD